MNGKIFDIQRFSIYDGPGIRTNVFFKGCNLRCLWCHNPESQHIKNELMFYSDKCIGCGECSKICKNTFTDDCTACGKCVEVCSHEARKISGEEVSADEVVEMVLKDKEYYKTSGGGVTLSGGEALLQVDFAEEILRKCKEHSIHTAIETAGCVPWESIMKIIDYTDLFLYDIKGIDRENHIRNTGKPNDLILDNARKLKSSGKDILFRMPVIPGYNMYEVSAVAEFTGDFPFEILAYHATGNGKYHSLAKDDKIITVTPPTVEEMKTLAKNNGAIYNPTGI